MKKENQQTIEEMRNEFINHPDLAGAHGYCNKTFANKIADWWIAKLSKKSRNQQLEYLGYKARI